MSAAASHASAAPPLVSTYSATSARRLGLGRLLFMCTVAAVLMRDRVPPAVELVPWIGVILAGPVAELVHARRSGTRIVVDLRRGLIHSEATMFARRRPLQTWWTDDVRHVEVDRAFPRWQSRLIIDLADGERLMFEVYGAEAASRLAADLRRAARL